MYVKHCHIHQHDTRQRDEIRNSSTRLIITQTSARHYTLQRRHNGRDSVSNHQPHDCLLNRYSDADQRKHRRSASQAFVRGIVTRKMFPFDDVIMIPELLCKLDKFNFHSLQGFSLHVKKYLLAKYADECTVQYETVTFVRTDNNLPYLYTGLSNRAYTRWCICFWICYSFTNWCMTIQITHYTWLWIRLYVGQFNFYFQFAFYEVISFCFLYCISSVTIITHLRLQCVEATFWFLQFICLPEFDIQITDSAIMV